MQIPRARGRKKEGKRSGHLGRLDRLKYLLGSILSGPTLLQLRILKPVLVPATCNINARPTAEFEMGFVGRSSRGACRARHRAKAPQSGTNGKSFLLWWEWQTAKDSGSFGRLTRMPPLCTSQGQGSARKNCFN